MEKKQTKVLGKYLEKLTAVCNTIAKFESVCVMRKSVFGLLLRSAGILYQDLMQAMDVQRDV